MKSFKAGVKLLWPLIAVMLLLAAGIVVSLVSFTNIKTQMDALYYESYVVRNAADTVNETFEVMQTSVYRTLLNNSEAMTKARNCMGTIKEQVALMKQNSLDDMAMIPRLEQHLSELEPMQEHVLDLAAQKKNTEALEYMENNNVTVIKEAQAELTQLVQAVDAKEAERMASLRQTQKISIILLVFLGFVSILFGVGLGIYYATAKEGKTERLGQCR